jgi:hypothetical protein
VTSSAKDTDSEDMDNKADMDMFSDRVYRASKIPSANTVSEKVDFEEDSRPSEVLENSN